MNSGSHWLFSIIRIAGASFPVSASLVQLQAEINSNELDLRLNRLEDPISHLHPDIPVLSKLIYSRLQIENSENLNFDDEFYTQFNRPLTLIESEGFISADHCLGRPYPDGIELTDPSYIMYMCALSEDDDKMKQLINIVDKCTIGESLHGALMQDFLNLPLPVIESVFEIFESKGYGVLSKIIGRPEYTGIA